MKQGQINQVFIFLFALFIIAALVILGVRSIGGMIDKKCEADLISFKDDFGRNIKEGNGYRAVETYKETLPCDYDTICMIDATVVQNQEANNIFLMHEYYEDLPFIIRDSIEDMIEANVFLQKGDIVEEIGYVPALQLPDPTQPLCITPTSGSFTLILKGQGRTTEVTEK